MAELNAKIRSIKCAVIGLFIVSSMITMSACVAEKRVEKPVSAQIPTGDFTLIAHYADVFLSANNGTGGHRTIFAQTLIDGVDEPNKADEINDYYILDIRKPDDYAAGHVAGAVNVQLGDLAKRDVLATLPTDKPILIICSTGHTASIANAILSCLGYDAWTLRFGMASWGASTPTAVWSSTVKQDIKGGNYAVVTGTQP